MLFAREMIAALPARYGHAIDAEKVAKLDLGEFLGFTVAFKGIAHGLISRHKLIVPSIGNYQFVNSDVDTTR